MREGTGQTTTQSINHVLKKTVNWETKSLPEFVRLAKKVAKDQYMELRSSLLSAGKYRLTNTHKHFEVSKGTWMDMTNQQRPTLYDVKGSSWSKTISMLHRRTDQRP